MFKMLHILEGGGGGGGGGAVEETKQLHEVKPSAVVIGFSKHSINV